LIVVLAIVTTLSALAIPGLARLGAFSNDSLPRASRELFEMLSAARIYATTWNVRTAVVYNLDNYQSPVVNPTNDPVPGTNFIQDSINAAPVRFITGAAIMYALPGSEVKFSGALRKLVPTGDAGQQAFVPADGKEGQWNVFDDGIALLLTNDPAVPNDITDPDDIGSPNYFYFSDSPRFDPSGSACQSFASIGMYCGLPVILDYDNLVGASLSGVSEEEQATNMARFAAHVFTPDGQVIVSGTQKERYTFYMGFRPDEPYERRLNDASVPRFVVTNPDNPPDYLKNVRVVPLELYRSTGRVKIAS